MPPLHDQQLAITQRTTFQQSPFLCSEATARTKMIIALNQAKCSAKYPRFSTKFQAANVVFTTSYGAAMRAILDLARQEM
jgi:hypothetical protein